MDKEKQIELDDKLVMAIEEVSYNLDDKFCIGTAEIEDNEVETEDCLTNAQLLALYLQSKGYGNVKQAVKEFAEKLKELFRTKHIAVIANVVCNRTDELFKDLYGEIGDADD